MYNFFYQSETAKVKLIETDQDQFVCGIQLADAIYKQFYKNCLLTKYIEDGEYVRKGSPIIEVMSPLTEIIESKNTILFYLSRLSAITSLASNFSQVLEKNNTNLNLIEGHFLDTWNDHA